MDIGRIPAIDWIDIVRTGGADTNEIGKRPHQHVIAGPRPGFIGIDAVVRRINPRVEKEVDRRPRAARPDAVRLPGHADVVGAVEVAEEPALLVAARGAGECKGVVPADGVLHQRERRFHVLVEELVEQPRHRVGAAHQGAGDGRIEMAFDPLLQRRAVHREEIGALPALDIDDLDVFAPGQFVSPGGPTRHGELVANVAERHRQLCRLRGFGFDLDLDAAREIAADQPIRIDRVAHEQREGRGRLEHQVVGIFREAFEGGSRQIDAAGLQPLPVILREARRIDFSVGSSLPQTEFCHGHGAILTQRKHGGFRARAYRNAHDIRLANGQPMRFSRVNDVGVGIV